MKRTAGIVVAAGLTLCAIQGSASGEQKKSAKTAMQQTIQGQTLSAGVMGDGSYFIKSAKISGDVLRSDVEANVDGVLLRCVDYPQHTTTQTDFHDAFGSGSELTEINTGLAGKPELILQLRLYSDQPWGDIQVKVMNSSGHAVTVSAIRSIHALSGSGVNLKGPDTADRVLSDSYSEDRPALKIHDLADGPGGMHRAVGSQLIYNRESKQSLFLGALTSDRLLTIFHLKEESSGGNAHIVSYDAESTGTTEIMKGESLLESPAGEQVELKLPVAAGESLSSERLMFEVGDDYLEQLQTYGHVVSVLHKARVATPTPLGWWSWTAYYFGLNQGTALTNVEWLSQNLKDLGFSYFQIDEGYQYARGEYTTPDARLFPRGMEYIGDRVRHNGITFGIWTAPFEVSERSWVFQNHKDWLLHNSAGQLIHIGYVTDHHDALYVLDTTNPGSQDYLRNTYSTLVNVWGVRFIKMDFMDDTAVEGAYYRPNTTAMEAQRIGLKIIRETVGEHVVLDKDGSTMLNPVGIVDAGRISQDTGHTFDASRDAASGIAARFYMNRNYFVADPDAFTVATQVVDDQAWHGGQKPLTLDEAKVSIALAAVSGGMFEVGDDLPTLGSSAERLALVKNTDLINMARLGHASIPMDLMSYRNSDEQPSIFVLKQDARQTIVTVFNWTEQPQSRTIDLASLGLRDAGKYQIINVLDGGTCCGADSQGSLSFVEPPHSVRMFKLIDTGVPQPTPAFNVSSAADGKAGETLTFRATVSSTDPIVKYHWEFGDGVALEGTEVTHAYTQPGTYTVQVMGTDIGSTTSTQSVKIVVTGDVSTTFTPEEKVRLVN
ncbi:MAG: PKD domain-containing protein [Acidobacteria bacterium]|nr:PKD domain-containing protein [Acidobacteriota bacterium]